MNSGDDLLKKEINDRIKTNEELNTETNINLLRKTSIINPILNKVHPTPKNRQILEAPNSEGSNNTPTLDKGFSFYKLNSIVELDPWTLRKTLIRSVIIAFFEFLFELLAVINLVLMTYYRLEYLADNYIDICFAIEIVVLIFFLLESISLIRMAIRNWVFSNEFYLRICCNILMIFQICWMLSQQPFLTKSPDVTILINVIRSFRIFGIKNFFEQIKKAVSPEEGDTENISVQMSYFVLVSVINIVSAIFIEATLFLAFDALEQYNGYVKPNVDNFEYISAMYFAMVTITTIGYGDIYPTLTSTRMVMICILFLNLSVVSVFLGKLTDVIYLISPYIKQYKYKNHLIIAGEMPMTFLRYFLLELQESDKIQRNLFNEKTKLGHVIIMNKKEPSSEMKILMNDPVFWFEIDYLMDDVQGKSWFKLSNLKQANHLFLFSLSSKENEQIMVQKDLLIIAIGKKVEAEFDTTMTLVLSTDTCENFASSFSKKVTVISHQLLNNQLIANSLENHGFNTWLTHLMTLREKEIPFVSESEGRESNFFRLFEYAKSMTQEVYTISNRFYEKSVKNVKFLFFFLRISTFFLRTVFQSGRQNALFQPGGFS